MNLEELRSLSPFTAEALLDHANQILAPRPRVTKRTLRFYISKGVVPPHLGSPKFARYTFSHLLRLLAARALQDQGKTLSSIVQITEGWSATHLEDLVNSWLPGRTHVVRETRASYHPEQPLLGQSATRITLTDKAVLEMTSSEPTVQELINAQKELAKLIKKLEN